MSRKSFTYQVTTFLKRISLLDFNFLIHRLNNAYCFPVLSCSVYLEVFQNFSVVTLLNSFAQMFLQVQNHEQGCYILPVQLSYHVLIGQYSFPCKSIIFDRSCRLDKCYYLLMEKISQEFCLFFCFNLLNSLISLQSILSNIIFSIC